MTYTVEPHGAGWALYKGRTNDRHGYRLCSLTDGDQAIYAAIADALNVSNAVAISLYAALSCREHQPQPKEETL